MQNPFFSIIIPTLNEEKYLPQLLDLLTNQYFRQFEVIVVDHHSHDNTVQAARSYTKKLNIKILSCDAPNVAGARNMGGEKASGNYLLFFDADITIKSNFLEELKNRLDRENIDVGTTKLVHQNPKFIDKFFIQIGYLMIRFLYLIGKPVMSGQNILMTKSAFEKLGGFDPTVVFAEDIDLPLRALKKDLKIKYFWDLSVIESDRRFKKEGILVWWKFFIGGINVIFRGPIRKPLFEYSMGGKDYVQK